jgi:hypothetical protein
MSGDGRSTLRERPTFRGRETLMDFRIQGLGPPVHSYFDLAGELARRAPAAHREASLPAA